MHPKTIGVAAMSASWLWLSGCAAPVVRPDDMSAAKHRQEAEHESRLAREQIVSRVPATARAPTSLDATEKEYRHSVPIYSPLDGQLAAAELHRQHARDHSRAADFLERFEAVECRDFSPSSRAACPLLGPLTSVDDIPGGVRARFKPGTPVDAVVAHMRCHYAYARARAFDVVASCPLYMRGIDIRRDDDPMAVDIVSADGDTAAKIRARSREEATFVRNQ
jgi:hypothetical protein